MIYRKSGLWIAVCLDFDLVTQGHERDDAMCKLRKQIYSYINEATQGEDTPFSKQLMNRRSPWYIWLRYFGFKFSGRSNKIFSG